LQTRCPHCKTLFEIRQAQLHAANGQARCSCCDNIFNARKNLLQNITEEKPVEDTSQPRDGNAAISLSALFDQDIEEIPFPAKSSQIDQAVESAVNAQLANRLQERKASPKPSGKLSNEHIPLQEEEVPFYTGSLIKREIGDEKLEQSASHSTERAPRLSLQTGGIEKPIIAETPSDHAKRRGRPILWLIALLCLLGSALAQLTWFLHGDVKRYPELRQLLELTCAKTGCQLPPWREPERFVISSRSVKTHPQSSSALQIQLVFSNQARFAQPYPQLRLQFYDTNEQLTAQRVFTPAEYLAEPATGLQLLEPSDSVEIDMALLDPGTGVTGFKIEFL